MTEFRSAVVDTSPFIYYIEKSELYFEKMKSWFSQCYELEKSLITSPHNIRRILHISFTESTV